MLRDKIVKAVYHQITIDTENIKFKFQTSVKWLSRG